MVAVHGLSVAHGPLLPPLPSPPVVWMCETRPPLPRRMRRMAAALRSSADTRERLLRLARLGDRLPAAPIVELGERTRVTGCTSVAHVLATTDPHDATVRATGAADSRLARGMLSFLVRGVSGEPAAAIRALRSAEIVEAAGLPGALSSSRLTGLGNMLDLMRSQLAEGGVDGGVEGGAEAVAVVSSSVASSSGRSERGEAEALIGSGETQKGSEGSPSADPVWLAATSGSWSAAESEVAVLLSGGVDR